MATLDYVINDLVVGDDYALEREIDDVPATDSLVSGRLLVKRSELDADADAVIDVAITASATADGQITDTGAGDTVAAVLFNIGHADTTLIRLRAYRFAMRLTTSNGYVYTPLKGTIIPQ